MSILQAEATLADAEEERVDPTTDAPKEGTRSAESASSGTRVDPEPLTKDVIFDILKNRRRRRVLEFLRERGTSTLSDVAEHVAALENGKEVGGLTSSERKRVYVGLYQCHLPRMSDAGVIDYDRARGTIELRESTNRMFPYLDLDTRRDTKGRRTGWRQIHERLPSITAMFGH